MYSSPVESTPSAPQVASSGIFKKILGVVVGVPLVLLVGAAVVSLRAESATEQQRREVAIAGGKCEIVRIVPGWLSGILGDDFHTFLDQSRITKVTMGDKIVDEKVGRILAVPTLEILEFDRSPVTSACLSEIAKLSSLRSLTLSETQVTDISPLAALPNLIRLDLSFSKTRDADLSSLSQFPSLRAINARGLLITDKGVEEIAKCSQLEEVGLTGAKLSATGLRPLQGLKNLKKVMLLLAVYDSADLGALKAALPECKVDQ
jgi:Leucine-rich repeat (LRR) protein